MNKKAIKFDEYDLKSNSYAISMFDENDYIRCYGIVRGMFRTFIFPKSFLTPTSMAFADFSKPSIIDSGQTLKFGDYEADFDSIAIETFKLALNAPVRK